MLRGHSKHSGWTLNNDNGIINNEEVLGAGYLYTSST